MNSENELLLVEGAEGILAIGSESALDQWQESAGEVAPTRQPPGLDLSSLAAAIPELMALGKGVPHRFLPTTLKRGAEAGPRPPEVRRIVFGRDGRAQSSELLDPTMLLSLNPQLILVQAAVEVLSQSLAEIREELVEVREGVQELLRQSEAERLGDIYGRNKVLRRVVQGLHSGETLSTTDWDSLASLGPDLQIGTEKLRRYLEATLRDLDYEASPGRRVRQLDKFLAAGRFVDHLKLLVVAEESLALYQRIRLERVRNTEPEALEQTVRSIQQVLESNVLEDMSVAEELSRVLSEFAVLRPAEGLDILNRRRMDRLRGELQEVAQEFIRHRTGQAEEWSLSESARVKDAIEHYRQRMDQARRKTLQATADGLSNLAKKIEPEAPKTED